MIANRIVAFLRRVPVVLLFVSLTVCVILDLIAVYVGQDVKWDLLDYLFCNPYALLNGRVNFDYARPRCRLISIRSRTFHSIWIHHNGASPNKYT
jgi:hypothetical protein